MKGAGGHVPVRSIGRGHERGLDGRAARGRARGGPVFPALFLGAAAGLLLSPLPGLGVVPAVAAGLAAATAVVLRMPVSSAVLVTVLLGNTAVTPLVIMAVVAAMINTELLPGGPLGEGERAAPTRPAGSPRCGWRRRPRRTRPPRRWACVPPGPRPGPGRPVRSRG
ncbi:chloride channel protein, partial [Streptomyces lavendulae]|uniref:chloride channel protein n=1 Tax=Streptomyces lavendulae TaxID=1914 RepID=UPI00340378A9